MQEDVVLKNCNLWIPGWTLASLKREEISGIGLELKVPVDEGFERLLFLWLTKRIIKQQVSKIFRKINLCPSGESLHKNKIILKN